MEIFCLCLSYFSLISNNCWLLPLLEMFPTLPSWYCSLPKFSSLSLPFSVFSKCFSLTACYKLFRFITVSEYFHPHLCFPLFPLHHWQPNFSISESLFEFQKCPFFTWKPQRNFKFSITQFIISHYHLTTELFSILFFSLYILNPFWIGTDYKDICVPCKCSL